MSDLTPNELRRMNWYIRAVATGINYAVDDSIDHILTEKKFLEAAGWGKARLTSAGISTYQQESLNEQQLRENHLLYSYPPSTVKAYLKKQNMMLVANHILSKSRKASRQQAR